MPSFPCSTNLHRLALCAALALPDLATAAPGQALVRDDIAQRALACMACHGEASAANSAFFPRIAGKPTNYLVNQLRNFRDGRRRYPAMNYLVAHLSDDYLLELAAYFSALRLPTPVATVSKASAALVERGRRLALHGESARQIPACTACHGDALAGMGGAIPGLLGLPRDYVNAQFGAWKSGARKAAAPDCMGQVSRQLSAQDIEAVAAWLGSQAASGRAPAPAQPGAALPLACGSVPQ